MTESFVPRAGAVFSADIAVPDHERVMRFYSRVLGTGENPLWREEDLLNNMGMPIIGLGARSAETDHLPIQWMPHIQVREVASCVQRAEELGANVLMHATSDAGTSQWAVISDPGGAAFGIIPVVPSDAISPVGITHEDVPFGRIAWLDLTVPDANARVEFYRQVIGWSTQDVEMSDADSSYADYNMLGADGEPVAGVCHARGVNAGLPAVWMIYLPVADLEESIRRVESEGGTIVKATRRKDGDYAYAAIRDPAGATLALVQG